MAELQGKILSVLGLQRPEPGLESPNKLASHYMTSLYKQINELDQPHNFNPTFEFLGPNFDEKLEFDFQQIKEDSHTSDIIISFMPTSIIKSQDPALSEIYELAFFNLTTNYFDDLELKYLSKAIQGMLSEPHVTYKVTYISLQLPTSHISPIKIDGVQSGKNSAHISINITQIFKQWRQHPEDVHKLFVQFISEIEPASRSVDISQIHCFGVGFFLESEHERDKRIKRSISENMIIEENWDEEEEEIEANSHEDSPAFSIHKTSSTSKPANVFSPLRSFTGKRCKLRSLYVDFKDLGWDSWVIAPTGYQADYCDGDCSFPLDSSVTPSNHAIVQTLVHVLDERRALPAHCAPIALKSQSILFFNNQQNVVMRRYQNMRVKQCGCR
uniref:TGF-beta family profile domain-containing protein n=1 Tax=Ditylenchus dipsaci TaxID=166011 RepID=A0A915EQC9_9BILA